MRNEVKSRLITGILVLIVVGLGAVIGGDVTVQDGDLDVDRDLSVGRYLDVSDDADIDGYLDVDYDLDVG